MNSDNIWWRFSARCKKPKTPLKGVFIAAFFVTTAIELLQQCKASKRNCRNSPNGPLAAIFWAFAVILAHVVLYIYIYNYYFGLNLVQMPHCHRDDAKLLNIKKSPTFSTH